MKYTIFYFVRFVPGVLLMKKGKNSLEIFLFIQTTQTFTRYKNYWTQKIPSDLKKITQFIDIIMKIFEHINDWDISFDW